MERITRRRALILLLAVALVLSFFAFKIYDIQIIQTGGNTDNTSTFTTYTRVKAARGDILDKNGNVLVSNRASYDLVINHYVLLSASGTNNYLYNLIKLCDSQGITYTERFPISQERPFTYTLSEYNTDWQGYFQTYLEYKGGLDSDITAPLLVEKLRDKYKIPPEWTDDEARRVMGLRYELDLRQCVGTLANYVFLTDASDEDLSVIMELNIPGLNVEASTVREYNTAYAAHILGYVGAMNPQQWEYYKNIDGYEMDAEVGQDGLEEAYEEYLHGVDGWREDTVATDGTLISSRYITEPQAGANVEVSIDIALQRAGEDALKKVIEDLRAAEGDGSDASGGAVVATNVKTGQVLVCGSYPSYDLSRFFQDYTQLAENEEKPLYNRALMGTYPPGSTYKMSMVVAAIDSGVINSETTITDQGKFRKYDGFEASCLAYSSHGGTHGTIDAAVALQKSCNYFFYVLGDTIGLTAMDNTAKMLGLGEPTGVELYESTGQRANAETKEKLYKGDRSGWYKADQILAAIGQSDNRFTPMQLCVYTATLANQGRRYKATFMSRVVSSDYRSLHLKNEPTLVSNLEMSDEAYNTVKHGMYLVAHEPGGTAIDTFRNYPITVGAKTGTAQTGIPNTSDNAAFVCYAPLDDPQIAIAIYVEKGGHGYTLGTVAKEILDVYFSVGETGDVNSYENQLS
ncbi:MAG: hypothetical protein IKK41_00540 [Oscillospiraceae bacterium]|nr:hypothetical protein [Oscillospiraceae bacterium]